MRRFRIAVSCLSLLLSTSAWADLKVYDVDFELRQEVYEALRGILWDAPNQPSNSAAAYGRVQLLPTGQILVDALPETHAQIESLLDAIQARQVGETPRVTFRYWVVLGSRGGEADTAMPSALSDVLAELERVHGDLTFRVLGTASLATESGQEGDIDGRPLGVTQRTYVQGRTVTAEIEMQFFLLQGPPGSQFEGELDINATLAPGEFLVLAENTIRTNELDGTLFYIVHWPDGE